MQKLFEAWIHDEALFSAEHMTMTRGCYDRPDVQLAFEAFMHGRKLRRYQSTARPKPTRPSTKRVARGEDHSVSKLTDATVREMRRLAADGWRYSQLGDLFSVNATTVRMAALRHMGESSTSTLWPTLNGNECYAFANAAAEFYRRKIEASND